MDKKYYIQQLNDKHYSEIEMQDLFIEILEDIGIAWSKSEDKWQLKEHWSKYEMSNKCESYNDTSFCRECKASFNRDCYEPTDEWEAEIFRESINNNPEGQELLKDCKKAMGNIDPKQPVKEQGEETPVDQCKQCVLEFTCERTIKFDYSVVDNCPDYLFGGELDLCVEPEEQSTEEKKCEDCKHHETPQCTFLCEPPEYILYEPTEQPKESAEEILDREVWITDRAREYANLPNVVNLKGLSFKFYCAYLDGAKAMQEYAKQDVEELKKLVEIYKRKQEYWFNVCNNIAPDEVSKLIDLEP